MDIIEIIYFIGQYLQIGAKCENHKRKKNDIFHQIQQIRHKEKNT